MKRLIITAFLLHSGCDDGGTEGEDASSGDSGSDAVDPVEVQAMADGYAAFERINATPTASQHGNASTVNWWVPAEYSTMYRTLDPDAVAAATFPEGALVVKEHLDEEGAPDGYTMMFKGPPGTNDEANEWWFARVTPDGALAENGAVGFCMNCHRAVEQSDWLYGVPLDNRR